MALSSSLLEPPPPCPSSYNSHQPPPLPPFPMADCCVLDGWGLTLLTLSLPLECCCLLLSLPRPPHQERRVETCEGGRGHGGNHLGLNTAPSPCCGRAGKASKRMFSWSSLSMTSLKTVFFCKNSQSYKKNKN
jgi:hypothetical protein